MPITNRSVAAIYMIHCSALVNVLVGVLAPSRVPCMSHQQCTATSLLFHEAQYCCHMRESALLVMAWCLHVQYLKHTAAF
jgi:hypothetical protein